MLGDGRSRHTTGKHARPRAGTSSRNGNREKTNRNQHNVHRCVSPVFVWNDGAAARQTFNNLQEVSVSEIKVCGKFGFGTSVALIYWKMLILQKVTGRVTSTKKKKKKLAGPAHLSRYKGRDGLAKRSGEGLRGKSRHVQTTFLRCTTVTRSIKPIGRCRPQSCRCKPPKRGSDCFLKLKTLNSRMDLSSKHSDLCFAVWKAEMLVSMHPKLYYQV